MPTRLTRFTAPGVGLLLLALLACGPGIPPGRSDIAAEAGGLTLAPERLAEWTSLNPTGRTTIRDAEFAALVWVDYALLAHAVERGLPLTDSATAAVVLKPDLLLQRLRAWHDTLVGRRPRVPSGRADSIYAGSQRLFQHILLRVTDSRDARIVGQARQKAESLLVVANSGEDFAALAQEHSEDSATAQTGFLPIVGRGVLAPEFERNAWQIGPGKIGGVGSRLGFHVVRRPPLEEVRDQVTAYAESLATRRADSTYTSALRARKVLEVTLEAIPALRELLGDPMTGSGATAALAAWEGGTLPLGEAARWINALPPRAYLDLRGASDVFLEGFVRDIATQYLLLEEAEEGGIQLQRGQWTGLYDGYRRGLRESLALLGLSDSTSSLPAGEGVGRANALLEALARDQTRWRPLPSALAAYLREQLGFRLHRAGLERTVAAAAALADTRASIDTTVGAPGGAAAPPPSP